MIKWIALFLLLPITLSAQPVTIRSGEHATFSRLVIGIGEGTAWSVEPTQGGYLLELTGRNTGFDLAEVFERIPRDRLIDVAQTAPNVLFLSVECDCGADAFLWRPGRLVVDIVDAVEQATQEAPPQTNVSTQMPADAPLRLPNLLDIDSTPPVLSISVPSESVELEPASVPAETMSAEILATQTELIEGLARAASQGVLNAAVPVTQEPPDPIVDEIVEDMPPQIPTPRQLPQRPGVGITTAMDRDMASVRDAIEARFNQQCLQTELFQINDWADERDFHVQVADLAEALAGEFGEEPREAQDTLARLYLHFGFGAEARSVLRADSAQSQARQVMIQLAGLIDKYDGDYSLIAGQAGCMTPAALWALIVAPANLDEDSRNHILQEFFGLPRPLRGQMAPRLARRFIEIGDPEGAARILAAAENYDAEMTHDVQTARSEIAEEFEDPQEAISILSQQIDDNARATPESLIRLIELGLANGTAPKESDLILASGMRQEYRDQPVADRLTIAEALGRISLGQYRTALDLLEGRDDDAAQQAINNAYAHITDQANSATFLEFAYGDLPAALLSDTENLMARRMIDLGFPERASQILTGPAEREAAAERRYLRAEAANGTGDYVDAIDGLLGMTDPRARELRAQAYTGLGEFRAALSASDQNTDEGTDPTLQFRAGAWERLRIEEDEVLSSFAQSVLAPAAESPAQSLSDRRALLAQSQESRRAVEGLLLRFDGGSAEE